MMQVVVELQPSQASYPEGAPNKSTCRYMYIYIHAYKYVFIHVEMHRLKQTREHD